VGSYSKLAVGENAWAMEALTGQKATRYIREDDGRWHPHEVLYPVTAKRHDAFFRPTVAAALDGNALFDLICKLGDEGYAMAAACASDDNGLVSAHCYSVLDARLVEPSAVQSHDGREADPSQKEAFRLVKVRNPWGKEMEWRGAWADGSTEWEKYPHVGTAIGYHRTERDHNDGLFWMKWEDFAANFDGLSLVRPRPELVPAPELSHAYREARLSFVSRCATDLFQFFALCSGVRNACVLLNASDTTTLPEPCATMKAEADVNSTASTNPSSHEPISAAPEAMERM